MPDLRLADVFLIEQAAVVENDVLKDVVLHGPVSNNGNEYSLAAMKSLVPLLEGRSVYVNHRLGKKLRDVDERFGHVQGVRVVEADHDGKPRVRGDLHFLRSHKDSAAIVESYTKGVPYFGTSLVGDGVGRQEGKKRFVEQMTRVASLDLVDRAATGSIVEQADAMPADPAAEHQAGLDQMVLAICHGEGTPADKGKKIQTLLETMAPGDGKAAPPVSEQTLTPAAVGTLVEQAVAKALTGALPTLVEQEVQRRAATAVYVKPTTQPPAPVEVAKPAAKDEPPSDPEKRKKWLRSA